MSSKMVYKIALGIEYDGSKYYGWQSGKRSSQRAGEAGKGYSQVANELITVFCAGRTDAWCSWHRPGCAF